MIHLPAMVSEVCEAIAPRPDGVYVDCTLGDGGHVEALLDRSNPDGVVIGIDRDTDAIRFATERLKEFSGRTIFVHGNYSDIDKFVPDVGYEKVDGILFDLGVSTRQLYLGERGFSFKRDGMLDMRMDREDYVSASDIVSRYSRDELKKIIKDFGEERFAGRIASAIVRERDKKGVDSTLELADIIRGALPPSSPNAKTDAVVRTFQGIRIAVNQELEHLERGLRGAIGVLKEGGRIAAISYHSLEDRIVKNIFRENARGCICPPKSPICTCDVKPKLKILTNRPVVPTDSEIEENPRVRSAKLRVAERLGDG
ncbi:MAG: 16S rRNA (cytosine(1402)-N(4))-methyltransferase RsmH [Nitrospinota bacterium]|nr:16S rRNA (cytosine(1402)-N(4))-methyltransferase RsmH [Nitrospinota bacterium]